MKTLTPSARSIVWFAYYIWLVGANMLLLPGSIPAVEADALPWVRVLGAVLLILGFYYYFSGRHQQVFFFKATVYGRLFALPFFVGLAAAGLVPWVMALGTLGDVAGALWTRACLKLERAW